MTISNHGEIDNHQVLNSSTGKGRALVGAGWQGRASPFRRGLALGADASHAGDELFAA
jgi:hypothetical protein